MPTEHLLKNEKCLILNLECSFTNTSVQVLFLLRDTYLYSSNIIYIKNIYK